jgi:HAD superfamily hydrolase (TIGR01549 family)
VEYDAVIFDLDGTLLESTAAHLEWLYTAVENSLREIDRDELAAELSHEELETLAGIRGVEGFEERCIELGIEEEAFRDLVQHFRAGEKMKLLEEDLLKLVDGTEDVLEELRRKKLDTAVVSNAPDSSVDEVIRYFDLARELDFFRGVTDLEDFRHRKPDPSHIELAREELDAGNCVYVGDSRNDVKAAERLGVDSIHIGETDSDATYSVDNLQEVVKIFRG